MFPRSSESGCTCLRLFCLLFSFLCLQFRILLLLLIWFVDNLGVIIPISQLMSGDYFLEAGQLSPRLVVDKATTVSRELVGVE